MEPELRILQVYSVWHWSTLPLWGLWLPRSTWKTHEETKNKWRSCWQRSPNFEKVKSLWKLQLETRPCKLLTKWIRMSGNPLTKLGTKVLYTFLGVLVFAQFFIDILGFATAWSHVQAKEALEPCCWRRGRSDPWIVTPPCSFFKQFLFPSSAKWYF